MKIIQLTQNKVTLVDDEDFDELSKYSWQYDNGYASRRTLAEEGGKRQTRIWMHRLIANTPDGFFTDHKNHNKLDNRKANLRTCTHSQNKANITRNSNNKSGYKGVYLRKSHNLWVAQITINRKVTFLGYFRNPRDAAIRYNAAALKHFGEFAYLNQVP